MDLLSGINLYSLQSAQMKKTLKKSLCEETEITEKTEVNTQQNTQISPKDVLDYMANQSVTMKLDVKKIINVKTIANTQEYDRISEMMKDFEKTVEQGMRIMQNDFPNISDNVKMKIVLNSVNKSIL